MVAPDQIPFQVLNRPTTLVNRFRIKDPATYGDQYLFVPGPSFTLPGEHALENVDVNPNLYPYAGIDLAASTYAYEAPAFVAWPQGTAALQSADVYVPLQEFRARHPSGMAWGGRVLGPASQQGDPRWPDLPGFCAPTSDPSELGDLLRPIYQHVSIPVPDGPNPRMLYDLIPDAHDGWEVGTVQFYAVPTRSLLEELSRHASEQTHKPATPAELSSKDTLGQLADATRGLLEPGKTVDQTLTDNLLSFFHGRGLPVRFFTTSFSVDAGFGIGGSLEYGVVWNVARGPVHAFTTLGAGFRIGAGGSVNPLNLGFWWGASEQGVLDAMQGVGLYETLGATYGLGLNFIVSSTTDFLVYGLTISPQAGVEVEVGGELGGTFTWFNDVEAGTPSTMRMPQLVHW